MTLQADTCHIAGKRLQTTHAMLRHRSLTSSDVGLRFLGRLPNRLIEVSDSSDMNEIVRICEEALLLSRATTTNVRSVPTVIRNVHTQISEAIESGVAPDQIAKSLSAQLETMFEIIIRDIENTLTPKTFTWR